MSAPPVTTLETEFLALLVCARTLLQLAPPPSMAAATLSRNACSSCMTMSCMAAVVGAAVAFMNASFRFLALAGNVGGELVSAHMYEREYEHECEHEHEHV